MTPVTVIAPEAVELVEKVRSFTGDPYGVPGLHFMFVVGETRREHTWDPAKGRIAVRFTRDDGVMCSVTTTVDYAGEDPVQREAWEMFVNDQFWLLAPAKLADPGATVTLNGGALQVRYDGVGVTPGDTYTYDVDPSTGEVRGWSYTLGSGHTGAWTWAAATVIGPLHLSLERSNEKRTIRFEEVRVEPVELGPPSVDCPLKTPIAP